LIKGIISEIRSMSEGRYHRCRLISCLPT